jgi:hypothetical protein
MFLYNLDTEDLYNEILVNKITKVIPETKVLDISLYNDGKDVVNGFSIWVPEDKYMIALTIANYEELLGITFMNEEPDVISDYLIEWFNDHNKEQYIKYDL